MGKVIVELSMSLDGFITGPNDSPELPLGEGGERLFKWYNSGDVEFPMPGMDMKFMISQASANVLSEEWGKLGAMVTGRRTFDIAGAWGGHPPGGGPCFVVTHHIPQEWVYDGSPFVFVTDGVENAIRQAQAAAGDKTVSVDAANVVQQVINAGLLDEIHIDLAPVLMGSGVRLFDHLTHAPIDLEIIRVVQGKDVTHLHFRVIKPK